MKGRIFDIKRFAVHDGPGIRTTVFFKGCPLRCLWCQNPEGLESGKGLWVKREKCIRCGKCAACCPHAAISIEHSPHSASQPGFPRLDQKKCDFCEICVENCPSQAIVRIDTELSVEALVRELLLDKVFFDVSGGGVTLSGGEPLAQSEFAFALLEMLKKENIHTCMETSLFAPENVIQRLVPLLDYLICDIKLMDNEAHRKYIGESNEVILENFRCYAAKFSKVLVRVPLIPGITAIEENLKAIGEFVRSVRSDIEIELLNYNWFSVSKYIWLDKPHFNAEARAFPEEDMARFYSYVSAVSLKKMEI